MYEEIRKIYKGYRSEAIATNASKAQVVDAIRKAPRDWLSVKAVAEICNIPRSTVHNRLRAIRKDTKIKSFIRYTDCKDTTPIIEMRIEHA